MVTVTNSECLAKYERYLADEKKASRNTLSSYLRDIRQFGDYLDANTDVDYVTAGEVVYVAVQLLLPGSNIINIRVGVQIVAELADVPQVGTEGIAGGLLLIGQIPLILSDAL